MSSDNLYDRINDYAAVKISLAKPNDIRSWSCGEVKKPETINYRTYRPERDGLFCEKIFGPERDWECFCGKFRGQKYKGMTCDRCGVKIAHSRVRRKRMGHIDLAAPAVHIWFFKAASSRLATLLSMKASSLEKVIYFQDYVVLNPYALENGKRPKAVDVNENDEVHIDKDGNPVRLTEGIENPKLRKWPRLTLNDSPLKLYQLLNEDEARSVEEQNPGTIGSRKTDTFDMGAEAIRKLLDIDHIDLVQESKKLRIEMGETKSKQRKKEITNRLKLIESLRDSDNRPEWMVLDVIPVIPPDLRPLVLLESGTFATSDLNDLYRRIINRNSRLKRLVDLNAPEVIIRNEKRMLQQSVDALFDNGRCKRPVLGSSNRPLKSLTDMIKGKQGRFRENLLGKRVDYSARSVIVVGPHLRLHQCGLPKKIALELFQPFIIRRLKELGHADTIKSAKKMLERKDEEVWDILEEVIQNHPVLLNRAPTLHRMGIQAFEPILVEGQAIKLHPLVCRGFNADFDGDQMAVHLPLSLEAQVEAHTLMLSTNNVFSPSNGSPIISPSQDIVMGCYYVTMSQPDQKGEGMIFSDREEVLTAYAHKKVALHALIKVRMPQGRWLNKGPVNKEGNPEIVGGKLFETTPGRIIFNDILPAGMPFYNEPLKSGGLQGVISDCFQYIGRKGTIELLDRMMRIGFEESTKSGLSFSTDDLVTPKNKMDIIARAEAEVAKVYRKYEEGASTDLERYNAVLDIWTRGRDEITKQMLAELERDFRLEKGGWYVNPIHLMATSGARGGNEQIRQLAGMRGLMAKPNGKIIETPIKANFREGLSVLEYFSSTHGARKGLADTALKTADSGYMTRKLADVAQNVVVTKNDCGTTQGIVKGVVYRGEKVEVSLADSIKGRVSRVNITHPFSDEVIVKENGLITAEIARKIEELGVEKIQIRSPMTCEAKLGICAKCYGMDLSTSREVEEGLAVGIIAAQSIGEPGTQLTMRTFHIGGTASRDVEESEIKTRHKGTVKFVQLDLIEMQGGKKTSLSRNGAIAILDDKGRELDKYDIPNGATITVEENQPVKEGQSLCNWDPHNIPIFAKVSGIAHYIDVVDGETVHGEKDKNTGHISLTVTELKGDRLPQIEIKSEDGTVTLDFAYLPGKAVIMVDNGAKVKPGTMLAKTPRDVQKTQDITGGLPRVTEIFEARKPKDPAVIAEIDGVVEFGEKRHGKRTIVIKNNDTGAERIHEISHGKHMRVHPGDYVKAGDAITDGPLVPHDILRISGEESVQEYLVREVQQVYRGQNVKINDKHIEIIVSQMLRKVRVEASGDTNLLEGAVIDKFTFRDANEDISHCVKIVEQGDTDMETGAIVQRDVFEQKNNEIEAEGGKPASAKRTELAQASTQLLGITKAAVQSSSFISAASFQETTKVLTEAALAGKTDNLVGLKENVILGHLVPAGTGFRTYQNAQWHLRGGSADEFAEHLPAEPNYPFLEDTPEAVVETVTTPKFTASEFFNEVSTDFDDNDDFETVFESDPD
ncbi:DNA-directed RNA polymerase subunit beta' [Planctomycetales bacterium]|nr:DNA-directed RNA polymerase subunit beta' [Planctomycetales bacterium]